MWIMWPSTGMHIRQRQYNQPYYWAQLVITFPPPRAVVLAGQKKARSSWTLHVNATYYLGHSRIPFETASCDKSL